MQGLKDVVSKFEVSSFNLRQVRRVIVGAIK